MKPNAVNDATIEQTSTNDDALTGSKILEEAQSLWYELREVLYHRLQLAALETRRAGASLVTMIIAGVMVAVLLNGAWLGLVIGIVQSLIEHGMVASTAILLAVAANLFIALLLCGLIRRKSRYLQFPAILGNIQPVPPKRGQSEHTS